MGNPITIIPTPQYETYFLIQKWAFLTFLTESPPPEMARAEIKTYKTSVYCTHYSNEGKLAYIEFGSIIDYCIDFNGQLNIGIPISQIAENLKQKYGII